MKRQLLFSLSVAAAWTALTYCGMSIAQNASVQSVWSVINTDGSLLITPSNGVGAVVAAVATNLALTGNPTAATQLAGNSTTRLATTAFVGTAVTNAAAANFASPPALGSTAPAAVTATALTETTNANNCAVTTTAGSAGNLFSSEPEIGTGYKKVLLVLSGYTAAGTTTITFPTAFAHTPSVVGNGTTLTTSAITVSTTQAVVPISTTQTGTISIEGE